MRALHFTLRGGASMRAPHFTLRGGVSLRALHFTLRGGASMRAPHFTLRGGVSLRALHFTLRGGVSLRALHFTFKFLNAGRRTRPRLTNNNFKSHAAIGKGQMWQVEDVAGGRNLDHACRRLRNLIVGLSTRRRRHWHGCSHRGSPCWRGQPSRSWRRFHSLLVWEAISW